MARLNKGPFIGDKNEVPWWRYDFRIKDKRFRDWLGPVSEMNRKQAQDAYRQIYAKALINSESSPASVKWTPSQVFKAYEDYIKIHRPRTAVYPKRHRTSF